jgi:release factor glutamine methyltransferase
MIYPPSEDSYLLTEEVKKFIVSLKEEQKNNFKVLDMGSGSGIQAKTCLKEGIKKENILAADINKEAIKELKKQNLKSIKSNLFEKIKKASKFNLIVFNAPYLPEDKYDKEADTTAGKSGNEIIIEFLKQAKKYLEKEGIILLLFSSLSKPKEILSYAKKQGYKSKLLATKSVGMFETLFVYEFW